MANPWMLANQTQANPLTQYMGNATPVMQVYNPWLVPQLPPQPRGPVPTAENRLEESKRLMNSLPQAVTAQNQQYGDLINTLMDKNREYLAQQGQGVESLEQYLQDVKQAPRGVDWTPAASFIDLLNDGRSNFAAMYAQSGLRPESERARQARITDLEMSAQKARQALSQSEIQSLRAAADIERSRPDPIEQKLKYAQAQYYEAMSGQKGKGKLLPGGEVSKLSDYRIAIEMAKDLSTDLQKSKELLGPVAGRAGEVNPYDIPAQQLQSQINKAKQVIGKALEGGVLRKEDEAKYRKILATMADEPVVALYKMQELEQDLKRGYGLKVEDYEKAGYNVESFKDSSLSNAVQGAQNLQPKAPEELQQMSDEELDQMLKSLEGK